jgi:hypothetical protein
LAAASAAGPAAMYPVPGTFDWSNTIFEAPWARAYCTAPSELYRGPIFTAALFGVDQHSGPIPESMMYSVSM